VGRKNFDSREGGTLLNQPKKLIEVALPLDAINKASAREKAIRHGHPSTLHLWWARRPLAAARAEIWQSWRRACAENADHPRAKELFDRQKLPAFQIESRVPGADRLDSLEAIGLVTGADAVTMVKNEMLYSLNEPGDLIHALVGALGSKNHRVRYLRRPFGSSSVASDLHGASVDSPSRSRWRGGRHRDDLSRLHPGLRFRRRSLCHSSGGRPARPRLFPAGSRDLHRQRLSCQYDSV
jgi:hypothetical protein